MKYVILSFLAFVSSVGAAVINTPSQAGNTSYHQTGQMLAFIPLNEAAGTSVVDITTGAHGGTFTNTPLWVAGVSGSGLNFTAASSQRISLGNAPVIGAKTAFTVSFWVIHTNGSTGGFMVYGEGSTGSTNPRVFVDINDTNAGDVGLGMIDNAGTDGSFWTAGLSLNNGLPHHIAIVQYNANPGQRDIFTDGVFRTSKTTVTGAITATVANLGVLQNTIFQNYLTGTIDQFRIYDVALTTAQIVDLYNAKR